MKAKNATPGTRVQDKGSGLLGTINTRWQVGADRVTVNYDAAGPNRISTARLRDLRLADKPVRPDLIRYPPPGPAYLLPGVHEDADPQLAERVRELGAEFGPVVVAIVAAQLTDPNYLIARLLNTGYQAPARQPEPRPDAPQTLDSVDLRELSIGGNPLPAAEVADPSRTASTDQPQQEQLRTTGPTGGDGPAGGPADGPAQDEVALRLLPQFDPELLCVFRNVGRVPVWVYDAAGGKVIAVGPQSTLEVPRSWAIVPGGETVRGFGDADESDPADRMRAIADAAWTDGYEACREGKQPHSPYRAHADDADV